MSGRAMLHPARRGAMRAWATPAGAAVVVQDDREGEGGCPRRAC